MKTAQTYRGVNGVEYRELIKPARIEITRVEGPQALCDKVQTCKDWIDADITLRHNSATVTGDGYDKHDFKVIFEDGLEYAGRYDLYHWKKEAPNLAKHVRSFVQWCAHDPKAVDLLKPSQIDAAQEMLKRYDLRQAPVPAKAVK